MNPHRDSETCMVTPLLTRQAVALSLVAFKHIHDGTSFIINIIILKAKKSSLTATDKL